MTKEDKNLLLKDLSARLPYGVKCCIYNFGEDTIRIKEDILWSVQGDNILTLKSCVEKGEAYMYHQIKPYLLPLSSMTEEQRIEYESLCIKETFERADLYDIIFTQDYYYDTIESIDYLYKNHIDIRGLIPMGLAIDATNKKIY